MARYPTLEEYAQKGNFSDGIKRCDELLRKSPSDVQLLTTKLQLLYASGQSGDAVLDQLVAIQPAIQDLTDITTIENAVAKSLEQTYPSPSSVHPSVSKIWDNACKASPTANHKWDVLSYRFSRAVYHNRTADAQQALIQIKAFQPKDRSVYMAHAAYTQIMSKSKDDLQSRLALSLARKAVSEKFDEDKSLDCRVSGQIFVIQQSEKDLASIAGRRFEESKQVYEISKSSEPSGSIKPAPESSAIDPSRVPTKQWLVSEIAVLKTTFTELVAGNAPLKVLEAFTSNAIRLFHSSATSLGLARHRSTADACFLAISGFVKCFSDTKNRVYLLQATFTAERLLKYNEHVHEARLILVYLYMSLNLGSLAMRLFESLRVKEIQFDTVGHVLFTQLSIIHPFATQLSRREAFQPHDRTQKALAIYNRHEEKLADCEASVLSHAQTGMVFDLNELRCTLRDSLVRRVLILEHRRTARLTGHAIGKGPNERGDIGPRKVANWTNVKDSRDFHAAFDYGLNIERTLFEANGQVSDQHAILHSLAADVVWNLVAGKQASLVIDVDVLLTQLEAASANRPAYFASAEYLASIVVRQLLQLLHGHDFSKDTATVHIDAVLTALDNLHIDVLVSTTDDIAEHLKDHYLYVDVLRIILAATRHLQGNADGVPDNLSKLQGLAKRKINQLQKHAQEQATSISIATLRTRMLENENLRSSVEKFGDDALLNFAEMAAASAKEGWEGVSKITLN